MQANILDAKNRLSELVKRAQAGEEVVISNRGVPVARLEPLRSPPTAAAPQDILVWLRRHPLPAHARRSPEEIDADILRGREESD